MPINIFHVFADISHASSKAILIWAIHNNKSAEGVSLLTQLLYLLVFITRYLDLFYTHPAESWLGVYLTILKISYITTSGYIVFLMMRVFARTREKEYAWKLATWSLTGSFLAAPVVTYILEKKYFTFNECIWTFSIVLECVCILPQLLLLRQTSVPTVFDSYYLVALGLYRALYVVSWTIQVFGPDPRSDLPISIIFGILQTALYVDFAWVYYSRQRVKLRGGGIIDSDDLNKSFIVNRFIGRRTGNTTDDGDDADEQDASFARQEDGVVPATNRWGRRGISVSADDTLEHHHEGAADAQMVDPSHFEDDHDDDFDADAPPPPAKDNAPQPTGASNTAANSVESSAGEWQDDRGASRAK